MPPENVGIKSLTERRRMPRHKNIPESSIQGHRTAELYMSRRAAVHVLSRYL